MSRTHRAISLLIVIAVLVLAVPLVAGSAGAPTRYIVKYEDGAAKGAAMSHLAKLGAVKVKDLPLSGAAVVYLPNKASARAAARVAGVATVEEDVLVSLVAKPAKPGKPAPTPTPPAAEVLPWGIDRIDAETAWPANTGDNITVAIVDTGIDLAHPDLAANIVGGHNAINPSKSSTDDNGHGTHVAGTVAAIDNEIGVIGVAPNADLLSVKVLDKRGNGYLSDIAEGILWSVDAGADVITMSLGASSSTTTLNNAVATAISSGVVVVAAAGNEGPGEDTVIYPAKLPGVITVAATDKSNVVASFSSRGAEVDIAAPGVSIYSTYKGGTYKSMSGTSMATPHVTGAVALLLSTTEPGDGVWTSAEVTARLTATATDLGPTGWDSAYGWGLVQVDAALGE